MNEYGALEEWCRMEKTDVLGRNLPHCHVVRYKSRTDCSGIENSLRSEKMITALVLTTYVVLQITNCETKWGATADFRTLRWWRFCLARIQHRPDCPSVPAEIWCCNASLQTRVVQHLQHRVLRYLVRQLNAIWGCWYDLAITPFMDITVQYWSCVNCYIFKSTWLRGSNDL
jgi:hypothetical protein